ncbi:MAG TPA: membrane protein insertase YidC [Candidatus Binataceae bacterium]|nr:membrane protein insertase YidC [Candidatus Binataceae bacterium]
MDSNRSLIIFILLLLAAIFYTDVVRWFRPPPKTPPEQRAQALATPAAQAQPTAGAPQAASSAAAAAPTSALATAAADEGVPGPEPLEAAAPAAGAPRTIEVDTNLYHAVLTTRGARLVSFRLKNYRESVATNSPLYDLVVPGERLPLGLVVQIGDRIFGDQTLDYTSTAPPRIEVRKGSDATLSFTADVKDGLRVTKTFTFRDGNYIFDIAAEAAGATAAVKAVGLTLSQPLVELGEGYRDYPALQADVKGKVLNEYEKELKKGVQPVVGEITYAGIGDRYFLSAFVPKTPAAGELRMEYSGGEARAEMLFAGALKVVSGVYMGPKQLGVLEEAAPGLSKAINFGWFGFLAIIFVRLLQLFHVVAPNYGWDIILLTLAVRLATLPASIKAQRSALRMQRLAPQVEKIREKFKNDSAALNREMMDLYKRNHVNPLGGCIPTAIQFPILYGLYEALLNAIELRHAPFIGWIRDLSAPDCYPVAWMPKVPWIDCHGIPVLVLLMGASTFLQQWMMPKPADPNQQKMMMWMPIFFTVLFIALPAGLSLYYFASNLLGIIQQYFLNREFKQPAPVAA